MADRKITDLTALAAGSQATGDLVTIVDVSESAAADKNKKMTMENLFKGIPGNVGIGTSSPGSYNAAADNLVVHDSGNAGITIRSGTSSDGSIYFNDTDDGNQRGIIRYVHASDALAFHTSAGESLRIDSSGRVLIGTISSRGGNFNNSSGVDAQFQIEGTSFQTAFANIVRNSSDDSPAAFALSKSRGTSPSSNVVLENNDKVGEIAFQGSDGSKMVSAADIECEIDGNPGSGNMPGRLIFSTNAGGTGTTERMQIDSSGNVGIGVSSPSKRLQVSSTGS